jgi:hypothetical protein
MTCKPSLLIWRGEIRMYHLINKLEAHLAQEWYCNDANLFTSRNVKKIFKYPLSCPTTMSDQIVGLRECVDSHFGRNMSLIHLECTVMIISLWNLHHCSIILVPGEPLVYLYIKTSLALCLLSSNVGNFSSYSMLVTDEVLWYLFTTYLAALCWTISIRFLSSLRYGRS